MYKLLKCSGNYSMTSESFQSHYRDKIDHVNYDDLKGKSLPVYNGPTVVTCLSICAFVLLCLYTHGFSVY